MYNKENYIVYKRDVCEIVDKINMRNIDYYVLVPTMDKSLKEYVPITNECFRPLIDLKGINMLIKKIPNIEIITSNNKLMDNEYKKLLNSGKQEDLVSIIKTTYLRNKERLDNNKKISDKDSNYFDLAEKYLYSELSIVLNMSFDQTREYVTNQVIDILNAN